MSIEQRRSAPKQELGGIRLNKMPERVPASDARVMGGLALLLYKHTHQHNDIDAFHPRSTDFDMRAKAIEAWANGGYAAALRKYIEENGDGDVNPENEDEMEELLSALGRYLH